MIRPLAPALCFALLATLGCSSEPPGIPLVTGSSGGEGGSGGSGGGTTGLTGIISGSKDSDFETQPALAVNSKGELALAWLNHAPSGRVTIGYALSAKQGTEWALISTLESPGGLDASPPSLAVDMNDQFVVAWLATSRGSSTNDIYVANTSATTMRFGAPEQVTDPKTPGEYTTPAVVVSKAGTTVVAYSRVTKGGPLLTFASKPGSGTFGIWTRNQTQTIGASPSLCATRQFNNIIYATFLGPGPIAAIAASKDEGMTFAGQALWPNGTAAYGPVSCVAEGAEVWAAVPVTTDPIGEKVQKSFSIQFLHSADAAINFDMGIEAKDGTIAPYALNPGLALEGSNAVDIAYYSGSGNGDQAASVRWARFPTGKKMFDESVLVHRPIFFTPAVEGPQWMGDRIGFKWANGTRYVAYVDNAGPDGKAHVAFYTDMTK